MQPLKTVIINFAFASVLALTACTGAEGPMGPIGPQGPAGADGSTQSTYVYTVTPGTSANPFVATIPEILIDDATPDYTTVVCYIEKNGENDAIALPYTDTSVPEDYYFTIGDGTITLFYTAPAQFKFIVTIVFPPEE